MSHPFSLAARAAIVLLCLLSCDHVRAQGPCPMPATLELRVLLEGPLDTLTGLMDDDLRSAGLIPLTEPYTGLGYSHRGGGGGEVTTATMFETTGDDAIVDWVVVEVRYPNDPGRLLLSRSALIQRDGHIVDAEGTSVLSLCVAPGLWHLAVRHRNHLGIMTDSPVEFFSGQFGFVFANPVDLSSPSTPAYRNGSSRRKMGGRMAMWNGDVTFDGQVKYTGSGNDRDPILLQVGSTTPNNVDSGYVQSDVNLDAVAKYTGSGNDRDALLRNVGGTTPNNVRAGYIPKDSLTLRPNVHVVDPLAWVLDTTLSDLDSGNVLVFQVNTDMEGIDTGHVVVGGEYGGYLRKITQVDSAGSVMTLTTQHASLNDVFASGSLMITTPIGQEASSFTQGLSFAGPSFGSSIQFPQGTCVQGGLTNVTIEPTGEVRQYGEFGDDPGSTPFTWMFDGNVHLHGTLGIQIAACATPVEMKVAALKVPFSFNLIVPLAPPPAVLVIPVSGEVLLTATMKVEVAAGEGLTYSNDFNMDLIGRLGVRFDNGVSPILEMEVVAPSFGPGSQSFSTDYIEAKHSTTVEAFIKMYSVLGPYYSVSVQQKIKATHNQVTDDKDLEYKNGFKLKAGIKGEVWGKVDFFSGELESPTVMEYKWPGKMERISDQLQIGQEEEQLAEHLEVEVSSTVKLFGVEVSSEPASDVPVHFSVLNGGGSIEEVDLGIPIVTDAFGRAQAHWTLGTEAQGQQLAQARVQKGNLQDISQSPVSFDAEIETWKMEIVSGDEQIGSVNSELLNPLVVRVTNQLEEPIEALPVHFEVVGGTGSVTDDFVATSSEGLASTMFTLGFDAAAQNKVKAYALTLTGDTIEDAPQYFKAYIDPDTMMYAQLSGNYQSGPASTVLPVDLRVQVKSVLGQVPQEDVLVYFQVTSGGGSVSSFGTSTNSDGIASVAWTLGPDLSIRQKVKAWAIDVYGDTLRGGPLEFEACTIICPPTAMDIDGNVYPVVKIGCDCWFQENLRTHHFRNGDPITHLQMHAIAEGPPTGFYDAASTHPFYVLPATSEDAEHSHDGFVYNGPSVVDTRKLCPNGWRLTSWNDFGRMQQALGINVQQFGSMPAGILKLPASWPGDTTATNLTGFSLRPGRAIWGPSYLYGNTSTFNWDHWASSIGPNDWTQLWNVSSPENFSIVKNAEHLLWGPGISHYAYCRCIME